VKVQINRTRKKPLTRTAFRLGYLIGEKKGYSNRLAWKEKKSTARWPKEKGGELSSGQSLLVIDCFTGGEKGGNRLRRGSYEDT